MQESRTTGQGPGRPGAASIEGGALESAVDSAALEAFATELGGNEAFLADVIESFLEQAQKSIGELRAALAVGDAQAVGITAHGLKSPAAQVGAKRMAAIAFSLERAGKAGQLADAPKLLDDLEAESARVDRALRTRDSA